jgi:hypothetical protein
VRIKEEFSCMRCAELKKPEQDKSCSGRQAIRNRDFLEGDSKPQADSSATINDNRNDVAGSKIPQRNQSLATEQPPVVKRLGRMTNPIP